MRQNKLWEEEWDKMKRQPENDMKEKKHEENICKIKPQELEKKIQVVGSLKGDFRTTRGKKPT